MQMSHSAMHMQWSFHVLTACQSLLKFKNITHDLFQNCGCVFSEFSISWKICVPFKSLLFVMILSLNKPCLYDAHRSATVAFHRWCAYFSFAVELTPDEHGGLFSCNYMSSRTILILFQHKIKCMCQS